ncbi:MAG: hypothetical protein A2901_06365, partial [Elusimicrobia bacterium RIFCSPLOWO2_01_FULL_54_10]
MTIMPNIRVKPAAYESPDEQRPKIFTVSEFNRTVKDELEERFGDVWIEGEISNFRGVASSGHCYFCLKDADAQIDIVAFRGVMSSLKFKLEEGLQILVLGRASLYPQRGRFQVVASYIEPKGAGALQLAFEQLKKKLEAEGLFDPARKKHIPLLPQKIGIVTSPTGAAVRDILTVIDRRFANVEILIYPAKVQGEGAKEEISQGIAYLNENHPDLDVLLVGRGGGSIEDLWAFNEEMVARAIAASQIPIISCAGHEIDFTIADFVADLRAPTPSAAAELVVKNKVELTRALDSLISHVRKSAESFVESADQNLDHLAETLRYAFDSLFEKNRTALNLIKSQIALLSPKNVLARQTEALKGLSERVKTAFASQISQMGEVLQGKAGQLEALSPLAVLSRGYAV